MAYSETLAHRVRAALADEAGISEKKMFGGLAFMLRGNMCCGIVKEQLMVRVGPDSYADALAKPHARDMDFTGRPMKGMIYVGTEGIVSDAGLNEWVQMGVQFASSLPAK